MIRLFKRYIWIVVLVAILCLFPQALSSQARLNNRVLVTGLAIDKVEEGFEVTAQVVLPIPGSEAGGEGATLDFVTEKGASILEGISKISYKIGEIAGLSHANFIILGEGMLEGHSQSALDYFIRDSRIPNSIMLLFCRGSAKDQLKNTNDLELSVALGLQKVYLYKQASLNSRMVAMQEFIDYAYEPAGTSILPEIEITKDGGNASASSAESGGSAAGGSGSSSGSSSSGGSGSSSGSSSSGGSGSSNGGQKKDGRLKYYTPLAYFKKGEFKGIIENQDEIIAYLLTQKHTKQFDLVIKDVDDGVIYENASVGLRVLKKYSKISTDFSGNNPKLKIEITLDQIQLLEVENDNREVLGAYPNLKPYINKTLKDAIKKQIKEKITNVFETTKSENVDLFRAADMAYRFNKTEWQKYLKTCGNIDNYLENFEIEVKVNVKTFI